MNSQVCLQPHALPLTEVLALIVQLKLETDSLFVKRLNMEMPVLLAWNPSVALALVVPIQNDMSDTKPMTLHTQGQAVTLFVEMV